MLRSSEGYAAQGAHPATRVAGSPAPAWGRRIQDDRRGQRGKTVPLGHQEPIGCDTKHGMVVEPAPVATFKVAQPQLLFQLLIIPFDDPTVFGYLAQSLELGVLRQRRHPVLSWVRPPRAAIRSATIPPREVPLSRNPDERRVRTATAAKRDRQLPICAFPPRDLLEGRGWQTHRQLLH